MMDAFERVVKSICGEDDQLESHRLSVVEAVCRSESPELLKLLETVAIPHWFDRDIAGAISQNSANAEFEALFSQLTELPFCEVFALRKGFNIKKSFRKAIRNRMGTRNPERIQSISELAFLAFGSNDTHTEIERIYHQLWCRPDDAGKEIVNLTNGGFEDERILQPLSAVLKECLAADQSTFALTVCWAAYGLSAIVKSGLCHDDRLSLASGSLDLAYNAGSLFAQASAHELVGNLFLDRREPENIPTASGHFRESLRVLGQLNHEETASAITADLRARLSNHLRKPEKLDCPSSVTNFIFISAVTTEFKSHREETLHSLMAPDVWIQTQENFLAFGDRTLIELDQYIQKCDAVVHLVGNQTGSIASMENQEAILYRYPRLAEELKVDESFLRRLSYTQWEAWLAVRHNRRLYIAVAESLSDSDSSQVEQDRDYISNEEHLAALRRRGRYASNQLRFRSSQGLSLALLKNLHPMLEHDDLQSRVDSLNRRFDLVTKSELINGDAIPREEAKLVLNAIRSTENAGALVVASAGSGKSCVLSQVLDSLQKESIPYLAFKLDTVSLCSSAKKLGLELNLPESPVAVLQKISQEKTGILVIDQLDAISTVSGRKTDTWIAFEEIRRAVHSISNIRMIVACRDFDLDQDHRLRPLGSNNSGFIKVTVGKLTEAQLREALDSAGREAFTPTASQVEILRLPFHLILFLQGYPKRAFSRVGDLYEAYWERKLDDVRESVGDNARWNEAIDALASYMSEHQTLAAPRARMDNFRREIGAMVSANVLVETESGYQFFHESFFDYAFARRFSVGGQPLLAMLTATGEEQHLFRRAQVRQILGYRRENDPTQYYKDLHELLSSEVVRFHIRRMVVSELKRVEHPRQEEWTILEPFVFGTDLSRYAASVFRNHLGWFDLLNELSVWERWIASDNEEQVSTALWCLSTTDIHAERSEAIAELISPFQDTGGVWDDRLRAIFSWGVGYRSTSMKQLFFKLVERGVYDKEKRSSQDRDLWRIHYTASKEDPKFVIDLICLWFERAVKQTDDGETWNFIDRDHLNKSQTGSQLICEAANAERSYFMERFLPIMVSTIQNTEKENRDRLLNRVWPHLSNRGTAFDVSDSILLEMKKSFEWKAKESPSDFRATVQYLTKFHHETIGYLLLSGFTANPVEFANECIDYLVAHKPRLNIGYGSWSGSEGHGESAVSRLAIKAVTPHCDEEHLLTLEDAIINHSDDYEKSAPGRRGFAERLLLPAICEIRRSHRVNVRIDELKCSFPNLTEEIPPTDKSTIAKYVGSPIADAKCELMTDEQWVSAMKKYDGSTDRFYGGPVELSRVLTRLTEENKPRFANLALTMPSDLDPIYFSAILNGFTGRYANRSKDEKERERTENDLLPITFFTNVIERLHSLPMRPCGTSIVHCISELAHRELPKSVFEIVSYYAIEDPDPESDIWQDPERNYYGGDPYSHGINCVRGQAAETIGKLLYEKESRLELLRPTLESLVRDPVLSVRTCAIRGITPMLNFRREEAIKLFLACCNGNEPLWSADPFAMFIHYAIYTHYSDLRDLLHECVGSKDTNTVKHISHQVILAELYGTDAREEADRIRSGSDTMRQAAAYIYAQNISTEKVAIQSTTHLLSYLNDSSEEVRKEVARCFWDMKGERLLQLEDFVSQFVGSDSFATDPEPLLRALEESAAELPAVVCRCAERLLGFMGDRGSSLANREAIYADTIAKLVVRQYAQTSDKALKSQCLDLIDEMERFGYMGIGEELSKIDR